MNVLEGVRVVDLSQNIAGPHSTQILGDLGADVIKVEPPEGDAARRWGPPFWGGESPLYLSFNRNKRSITLDLKTERGREALWRLVDTADVFVQASRKGVMDRLGFGYDAVRARRPAIVYASVTGFGSEGPMAELPGYDPLIQAYSGVMSVTGYADGPPARVGGSVVDVGTGVLTALGILAALRKQDRSGESTHVEASLLATSLGSVSYHMQGFLASGVAPARQGTALAMIAPYEAFQTSDGALMIAAGNDGIFERLCQALGLEDLLEEDRFSTNPSRVEHRADLHELVEARTLSWTTEELRTALDRYRVPASPIHDISQVVDDTQVAANRLFEPFPHPGIPGYRDVSFPLSFEGVRPARRRVPPGRGEHSQEILRELGFSDRERASFSSEEPTDAAGAFDKS